MNTLPVVVAKDTPRKPVTPKLESQLIYELSSSDDLCLSNWEVAPVIASLMIHPKDVDPAVASQEIYEWLLSDVVD